jgi:hypothetical protein
VGASNIEAGILAKGTASIVMTLMMLYNPDGPDMEEPDNSTARPATAALLLDPPGPSGI